MRRMSQDEINEHTIFYAPRGSYLHNLNHSGSDRDFIRIVEEDHFFEATGKMAASKKSRIAQTVAGENDDLIISEKTFQQMLFTGDSQAWEAMYTPDEMTIIDRFGPRFRFSHWVMSSPDMMRHLLGKSRSYFYQGTAKGRRHVFRLAIYIDQITRYGQFNPRLTGAQRETAFALEDMSLRGFTRFINTINPYQELDYRELEDRESN